MKVGANRLEIFVGGGYKEFTEKEVTSALEKQIPKKPITDKERMITIYRCGCGTHLATLCDKDVIVGTMQNYCSNCGQALDWGDSE